MKKAMNKTLLIAALSLSAVAFVGFGASAVESGSAELQDSTATVFEIDGAYVRIHEDGNNGIKFQTNYLAAEFPAEIVESGTIVVPADVIGSEKPTLNNAATYSSVVIDTTDAWNEEGNYNTTYTYVYDIPNASFARELKVVSYVETTAGVDYTDVKTFALADIAQQALDVGSYDDTTTACLEKFSEVAAEGSVLDLSLASNASTTDKVEILDEFKGETNVAKVSVSGDVWASSDGWKVEFYKNYYKNYTKIALDYYLDGAENVATNSSWARANMYICGSGEWQRMLWVNRTPVNGWATSTWDIWGIQNGQFDRYLTEDATDLYNYWTKAIQLHGVSKADTSFVFYFTTIEAYNPVTVTNSATKAFATKEFTVTDNAATVFAGATNVTLTVFDPNGEKVAVTDGKFTPATAGNYRFLYKAVDANGLNVRGEYTLTVNEHGLINDFSAGAQSHWAPTGLRNPNATGSEWTKVAGTVNYLDSYEGATGVMQIIYTRPQTTTSVWGPTLCAHDSNFFPYDKEDYAEYAETGKLYIRMRVQSSYHYSFEMKLAVNPWSIKTDQFIDGTNAWGWTPWTTMTALKADWVTVAVDFKAYYEAFDTLDTNFEMMFAEKMPTGTTLTEDVVYNFYIDKIWVANP